MTLTDLTTICHQDSVDAGWWDNPPPFVVPIKLMLIVSEISEAMEADRRSMMDDKLSHRLGIEVELADAIVRICDLAGYLNLDLEGALVEKMQYNKQREDHKPSVRAATGGKKY